MSDLDFRVRTRLYEDDSVDFRIQWFPTGYMTRSLRQKTLEGYAESVVRAYAVFQREFRLQDRFWVGRLTSYHDDPHQPMTRIMNFKVSTEMRVIIEGWDDRYFNLREFKQFVIDWLSTSFPVFVLLKFDGVFPEQQIMNDSVQRRINERYAISHVNKPLPAIGSARPSPLLGAVSAYTQNVVDPQTAVYIDKNLANGMVTSLYDWNNVRSTLGQTPSQSPATRAAFSYQNVHRMHPNMVQHIINKNS